MVTSLSGDVRVINGAEKSYYKISQTYHDRNEKKDYGLWLDDYGDCIVTVVDAERNVSITRQGIVNGLDFSPLKIDPTAIRNTDSKFTFTKHGHNIIVFPCLEAEAKDSYWFAMARKWIRSHIGPLLGNFNVHHVIPRAEGIGNHELMTMCDYSYDHERNLIVLPTREADTYELNQEGRDRTEKYHNRTRHLGPHDDYSNAVKESMDEIIRFGRENNWDLLTYRKTLNRLIIILRGMLRNYEISLRNDGPELTGKPLLTFEMVMKRMKLDGDGGDGPGGGNGGGGDPKGRASDLANKASQPGFEETVQTTHLESSYNSANPGEAIAKAGATSTEIGGVGLSAGEIIGMNNSAFHALYDRHIFMMPLEDKELPVSFEAIQQVIRELAIGIFYHNKKPMFSLHFNDDATLYPVIGPEYENTLVGYVMGILDYIMKGYLNGGIFEESFIREWNERNNTDTAGDMNRLIDLKLYCAKHLGTESNYKSLRELMALAELTTSEDSEARFRSSFRIIADNPIEASGQGFLIGSDFRVEYTIEGSPEFDAYLKRYQKQHGEPPQEYQKLVKVYEKMAADIKRTMPKLPMCKDYFKLLGIIHFYSHYFESLKQRGQIPILEPIPIHHRVRFPSLLPPLPIRQTLTETVTFKARDVVRNLPVSVKQQLSRYASQVRSGDVPQQGVELSLKRSLIQAISQIQDRKVRGDLFYDVERMPDEVIQEFADKWLNDLVDTINQFSNIWSAERRWRSEEIASLNQQAKSLHVRIEEMRSKQIAQVDKDLLTQIQSLLPGKVDDRVFAEYKKTTEYRVNKTKIEREVEAHFDKQKRELNANLDGAVRDTKQRIVKLDELAAKLENPFDCDEIIENFEWQIPTLSTNIEANDRNINDQFKKFRIVGGCGVHLPKRPMRAIPAGKALVSEAKQKLGGKNSGQFGAFTFQGKRYYGFELDVANHYASRKGDYRWLKETLYDQSKQDTSFKKEGAFWRITDQIFGDDLSGLEKSFRELQREPALYREVLNYSDDNQQTLLHYICAHLRTAPEKFIRLIMKGPVDGAQQDINGFTALHFAAMHGNTAAAEALIRLDPNLVRIVSKTKANPLYIAVQHNKEDMVRILQLAGSDLNQTLTNGMSALYCAAHHGHESIALFLIKCPSIDLNKTLPDGTGALYLYAEQGNEALIMAMLRRGADPNLKRLDGMLPLHAASKEGHSRVVKQLCEAHRENTYVENNGIESTQAYLVDVNQAMPSGITALHFAAQSGSLSTLSYLLERGASRVAKGWGEDTPLMTAIRFGQVAVAECLIDAMEHTELQQVNQLKESAFEVAIQYGFFSLADKLAQKGVRLTMLKNEGKFEVTHYLARAGQDRLLEKWTTRKLIGETQMKSKDAWGRTPEIIALQYGQNGFVNWLRHNWNNSKTRSLSQRVDNTGYQVVHYAAMHGMIDLLQEYYYLAKPENGENLTQAYVKCEVKEPESLGVQVQSKTLAMVAAENSQGSALDIILKFDTSRSTEETRALVRASIAGGSLHCLKCVLDDPKQCLDLQENGLLHEIARYGNLSLFKSAMAMGVDVNQLNRDGQSALDIAIEHQQENLIDYLLDEVKTLKPSPRSLCDAAYYGDTTLVARLIEKGCEPNAYDEYKKMSALSSAVLNHQVDNVVVLLEFGANPDIAISRDDPIRLAVELGFDDILNQILPYSQQLDYLRDGESLLHLATKLSHWDCVVALLNTGVNQLLTDQQGKTASELVEDRPALRLIFDDLGVQYQSQSHQFDVAFHNGNQARAERLLKYFDLGDRINCLGNSTPVIHLALRSGASISTREIGSELWLLEDHIGQSTVMLAANLGLRNVVKDAIEKVSPTLRSRGGKTLLHAASIGGSVKLIADLVKSGISPNSQDHQGLTPLHFAVAEENVEAVVKLLALQADPNIKSTSLESPLFYAVLKGNLKIAQTLIDGGAQVRQASHRYQTPYLSAACMTKNFEMLMFLIANGADSGAASASGVYPVAVAAQLGLVDFVSFLSASNALVINAQDENGLSALHRASEHWQSKTLESLLKFSQSIENPSSISEDRKSKNQHSNDATLLMMAARSGRGENVKLLLDQGANIDAKDVIDRGVLPYAAVGGDRTVWDLLRDFRVFYEPTQQQKAFNYAAILGHLHLIESMVTSGFPISANLLNDDNALTAASRSGKVETANWLINQGIVTDQMNLRGETPLSASVSAGQLATSELLVDTHRKRGNFDIDAPNSDGKTLLHIAAAEGSLPLVLFLIREGANFRQTDETKKTALDYAILSSHISVAKLLMACGGDFTLAFSQMPESVGAIIQKQDPVRKLSKQQGDSSLMLATRSKQPYAVKALIQREDDVNQINQLGDTAMHLVEDVDVLLQLVEAGSDIEIRNHIGETALLRHVRMGRSIVVKALLAQDARVDITDKDHNTCLSYAYQDQDKALFLEIHKKLIKQYQLGNRSFEKRLKISPFSDEDKEYLLAEYQNGALELTQTHHSRSNLVLMQKDLETMTPKTYLSYYVKSGGINLSKLDFSKPDTQAALSALMQNKTLLDFLVNWLAFDFAKQDVNGNSLAHVAAMSGNKQMLLALMEWVDMNEVKPNHDGIKPISVSLHQKYLVVQDKTKNPVELEKSKETYELFARLAGDGYEAVLKEQYERIIEANQVEMFKSIASEAPKIMITLPPAITERIATSDHISMLKLFLKCIFDIYVVSDDRQEKEQVMMVAYHLLKKSVAGLLGNTRESRVESTYSQVLMTFIEQTDLSKLKHNGMNLLGVMLVQDPHLLNENVMSLFLKNGHWLARGEQTNESTLNLALHTKQPGILRAVYHAIVKDAQPLSIQDYSSLCQFARIADRTELLSRLQLSNPFTQANRYGYDLFIAMANNKRLEKYLPMLLNLGMDFWATQADGLSVLERLLAKDDALIIGRALIRYAAKDLATLQSINRDNQHVFHVIERVSQRRDKVSMTFSKYLMNHLIEKCDGDFLAENQKKCLDILAKNPGVLLGPVPKSPMSAIQVAHLRSSPAMRLWASNCYQGIETKVRHEGITIESAVSSADRLVSNILKVQQGALPESDKDMIISYLLDKYYESKSKGKNEIETIDLRRTEDKKMKLIHLFSKCQRSDDLIALLGQTRFGQIKES